MTHLPFIAASYALGFGMPVVLGAMAAVRLRGVRRRLAVLDPRGEGTR